MFPTFFDHKLGYPRMRQIHVLVVVDLLPLFAYGLGHIMSVHVKVYLKKGYLKIHPLIIIFLMVSWGKSTISIHFPQKLSSTQSESCCWNSTAYGVVPAAEPSLSPAAGWLIQDRYTLH